MNRRHLLQLTGATFATGAGTKVADRRQQAADATRGADTDGQHVTTQDGDTANGAELPCEPDVRFGERRLVVDEVGISPMAYAEVVVENAGTAPSGELSLTASWLDSAGSFLDDHTANLPWLGADERWRASVRALAVDPAVIDGFEIDGEFEADPPRTPQGTSVGEASFDRDENRVTGVVENTRDDPLDGAEVSARLYDDPGTVLGGAVSWEPQIPAGSDWRFEIWLPQLPSTAESPEFDVRLNADSYRIQD